MWRYQADSGGGIADHIFQYFPSDFPNLPTTKWATSPLKWRPCPLGAAPVEVRHPHNRRRLELWRRHKKRNLSNLFQQFPKPMAGYAHDIMGNLNAGAAGWIDWNMLLGFFRAAVESPNARQDSAGASQNNTNGWDNWHIDHKPHTHTFSGRMCRLPDAFSTFLNSPSLLLLTRDEYIVQAAISGLT